MFRLVMLFIIGLSLGVHAENKTVVRYFVQGGAQLVTPIGDLDGERVLALDTSVDTSLTPESVALPAVPLFSEAMVRLGVHIDASSISVGFGYGRPMVETSPKAQPIVPAHATWLAFDFEYQYHFGYPGVWRPSLGANYGFARLDVLGAARATQSGDSTVGHVLFSGSMPGVVAGIGYYGFPHLSLNAEFRCRLATFQNLTTDANDYSGLSESLWQWMPALGVSAEYIF